MERALELPHDVDALTTLVLTQRRWLAERDEMIAQLEQHNRLLAKLVFGRSSEKRMSEPGDPSLQGHLFLADIAAEGLELSRSVLCESMARCAELLEPIAEQLRKDVLASPVVHTDDTPVTLAMPQAKAGGSREARVYLNRDGRHWYEFTESRKRDGPARVFRDFTGYLQADAYGGYDQLFFPGGATEVACWAHVRRKFVDAEATDPTLAKQAVDRIRALFKIEESAKELTDTARAARRAERAQRLLTEFHAWLELAGTQALPKSPLGKAIGYAMNQWPALLRYVEDGRLSISNNAAERPLRPIAIGRKNWLFFQREGG